MKDRTVRILNILANNKSIKITLLAELIDVSQATLRKDLDGLEKRGIIQRIHGYASLEGADIIGRRLAFDYSIKRKIAKAAAQIVQDGETIMVESGSCCAMFAEELAHSRKNATIITNSVFLSMYVGKLAGLKIILLGGYYQPDSQVVVGPMTAKSIESIYLDKFFLGTDGFIPDHGFTGKDYYRAETALALARHANNIFILTEAAKFSQRGVYNLLPFETLDGVFTDDKIPKEAEAILAKNKVQLYKVPAIDEVIKWRQYPGQPPILYKEKVEN
ncbi:MAG: DeoR/GlpR family DNA-binding transcription regulator [Treponema sp.]|nr:DeoR/GlpR family DNA-binding transcription regulator [Treponema sp.]